MNLPPGKLGDAVHAYLKSPRRENAKTVEAAIAEKAMDSESRETIWSMIEMTLNYNGMANNHKARADELKGILEKELSRSISANAQAGAGNAIQHADGTQTVQQVPQKGK